MAENIIYYGAPGTGKTYLLQEKMCDYIDYNVTDQQIINAFHKESSEWILVALVLIQKQEKMRPSQIQAKIDGLHLGTKINVISVLQIHSMNVSLPGVIRNSPSIFFEYRSEYWYVNRLKIQQYMPNFFEKFLSESEVERRYAFVTFHQSFSYEDFIEGIRPTYIKVTNSIDYSPKDGVFKEICKKALSHPEKEYALFIDEINRGNISEIFGELISLIEIDKRKDMESELSVTLPYSKEIFVVPRNLNIFGTMNSADHSVGTIDIALRRRFKFIPMNPSSDIIVTELQLRQRDPYNIDGINVIKLFDTINCRLELLLDRNHMIGQAMFLSVKSSDDIIRVIKEKVIPLLEEYFFDDLQKIQMVFNDLDESGELRNDAIYMHRVISADFYFNYIGDYLISDKKDYFINPNISAATVRHIYGE